MSMSNYPSDWDSRRRRVYRRDNYTCTNCGIGGGGQGDAELHAHHVVPISKGGTHAISNLTTVCSACHDSIHHKNVMAPTADRGTGSSSYSDNAEQEGFFSFILFCLLFFPTLLFLAVSTGSLFEGTIAVVAGIIVFVFLLLSTS